MNTPELRTTSLPKRYLIAEGWGHIFKHREENLRWCWDSHSNRFDRAEIWLGHRKGYEPLQSMDRDDLRESLMDNGLIDSDGAIDVRVANEFDLEMSDQPATFDDPKKVEASRERG